MQMKQFKDPIYGYVSIDRNIVSNIIDTPEFQRLRYIKQTSYLPVYSAALHNRFVHSLGVYFLGKKACEALFKNSKDIIDEYNIELQIKNIFELACLLHDVGHAPFSHSGEDFYIDDEKTIYNLLVETVADDDFSTDVIKYYHANGKTAAPHEIMSVIVALKQFSCFFHNAKERSFFARCITGYKYRDTEKNAENAILNAFVSLLNSTTIDVDRLDYLIRDAYVMGYNSISIDYDRLLSNTILVKVQDSIDHAPIQLAYKKSALSVIENVIYAHDAEKKWIQNHPVILYEVFLIQQLLASVKSNYKKRTNMDLFSLNSLLPANGVPDGLIYLKAKEVLEDLQNSKYKDELKDQLRELEEYVINSHIPEKISLLCDDDIIHFAKAINPIFAKELFNRNERHHPIWKSESEYKIYVDGFIGDESYEELQSQIKLLIKFLSEEAPKPSINQEAIDKCTSLLESIPSSDFSDPDKADMTHRYTIILNWLNAFKKIVEEQSLKIFDFVIVTASNFESSFKKEDLGNTPIYFPETGKTQPLKKLINLFSIKDIDRRNFFYVYYKKSNEEKIDALCVGKMIAKLILG